MKYRIQTNGKHYRVQGKFWFWPFWITCTFTMLTDGGTMHGYLEYETLEEAQELIDRKSSEHAPYRDLIEGRE